MHRDMGQPSAVEALLPPTLGQNQRLARIAAAVDWAPIGQLVATIYAAPVGRPNYPPLLLVKALLVRRAVLTPAKVYESEVAAALVCGDEGAVYGDRAYESKSRRQWLQAAGIKDRIMHRRHKHQRHLPPWQQRHNELLGPIRAQVEQAFGTLKRTYRYQRVRYRGLARNGVELWFKLLAYNLRKADQLLLNAA